jgi:hypothetical protein
LKVHLTFDVEVWCNGWKHLDRDFPAAFERYVYGRSSQGQFALPATLEILQRHGLSAVFFVEPLFAARFGSEYLGHIVQMIEAAGQNVQLHLHPEWTDEISPPPIADTRRKRQHLCYYTQAEQTELLEYSLAMLRAHTQGKVFAFRAGSYAANRDTYHALAATGISVDSSLNPVFDISGGDVLNRGDTTSMRMLGPVRVFPVTVFHDGLGRLRPAQVGACSLKELVQALDDAAGRGRQHFVVVAHNFEMLRPAPSSRPDGIVVRRFEGLCRYLAANRHRFDVRGFDADSLAASDAASTPRTSPWATLQRLGEQAVRRCY